MDKGSLHTFIDIADILALSDLCEYLIIEKDLSEIYCLCGSSSNLYQIVTKNNCFINLNEIITENSLNQLTSLNSSLNNEVWDIKFCHNDFIRYKSIIYFWSKDCVLLLLSEKDVWSCFSNPVIEKLFAHMRCFCYYINYNKLTIDFISPSVESILNYKTNTFIGKPVSVLFDMIQSMYVPDILRKVMSESIYNDITTPSTKYFITGSDNVNHLINQKQVHIGVDNRYTGLFCYVQELEGLLLDESNQKYIEYLKFVLESTDQGIWEFDISNRKISYGLKLEKLFTGKKYGNDTQYDDFLKSIHPDNKASVISEFNAFIDSDTEVLSFNFQFKLKNNDWRWIELKAKKVEYNIKGEAQKIIGIYSDISDKKQVELSNIHKGEELEEVYLKLKDNEEIFRQLVENTNDVFMLRDENNYIYINNQFEKIWGRDIFELIEDPNKLSEWIHPDDIKNVELWINFNQLKSGNPIIEQYRIVRPDGLIRWIWTRTYPVFNIEKKLYRIVSISTDITDQKDFEEALLSAKEKAMESDMLKTNFLANISHEIRTPMNGIVGFAELISREDLDRETRQNYTAIMKKSSQQLIRIIDDIIDFAKIEANQIRISFVKFNLNNMLDDLAAIFNNQLAASDKLNISLIVNKGMDYDDAEVISDDYRIRQILSNLIDNAVKFTGMGEIHFGYILNDDKIEFFVKDTGIGIPTEKHKIIFERFRQADEGHTRKYGGTGLGLPISKGLVNILGGGIWLESIPNLGATFHFTVPYVPAKTKITQGDIPQHIVEKYNWKDKTILIAEDDDMNFEYLKIILESTQAKVIRASDGSQVVKLCSNVNFDLILMDIRLPVMNGIEATRHIRGMGIKAPIIAQTAFALNEDAKNCIEAGCNRYITKPISKELLFSMVDSLLNR